MLLDFFFNIFLRKWCSTIWKNYFNIPTHDTPRKSHGTRVLWIELKTSQFTSAPDQWVHYTISLEGVLEYAYWLYIGAVGNTIDWLKQCPSKIKTSSTVWYQTNNSNFKLENMARRTCSHNTIMISFIFDLGSFLYRVVRRAFPRF